MCKSKNNWNTVPGIAKENLIDTQNIRLKRHQCLKKILRNYSTRVKAAIRRNKIASVAVESVAQSVAGKEVEPAKNYLKAYESKSIC